MEELRKNKADDIVTLVSRINALRSKLYHDRLDGEERRIIEDQVASFRLRLAKLLYEKNGRN